MPDLLQNQDVANYCRERQSFKFEFAIFPKFATRRPSVETLTALNSSWNGMGGSRCRVPPGPSTARRTVNVLPRCLTPPTKVSTCLPLSYDYLTFKQLHEDVLLYC